MDDATLLFIAAGAVFVVMALSRSFLTRLPLTTALVYLVVGVAIGPHGAGLIELDAIADAHLLERLTEIAVVVSLFTAGLKLRLDWHDLLWRLPLRLAFLSMAVTVGLIALVGVGALGLSLGAAILLGAILAPTDPVVASDVQIANPGDRDRLRFGLTGEAGLNDGTAFPFVMLGLGLLGYHELGDFGWRWLAVDLVWAVTAGLAIGALLGTGVGHLVLALRRRRRESESLDDFLTLGLIALAYGAALFVHAYGFLAVFAAGLALRRIERRAAGDEAPADAAEEDDVAAPATMTRAVLGFNEQLERIGEVVVVVLVGTLLTTDVLHGHASWFVAVLFLVIRPLAVAVGVLGSPVSATQRRLMAWFGMRGIGSFYYLAYAIAHGLDDSTAQRLVNLTLAAIAVSAVVHGISVTPLMDRYERRRARARPAAVPSD